MIEELTSAASDVDLARRERLRSNAAAWLFLTAVPLLHGLDAEALPPHPRPDGEPHEHLIFVGHRALARLRADARVAHDLARRLVTAEILRSSRLPSIVAAVADRTLIDDRLDAVEAAEASLAAFRDALLSRADAREACAVLCVMVEWAVGDIRRSSDGDDLAAFADPGRAHDSPDPFIAVAVDDLVATAFAVALSKQLAVIALRHLADAPDPAVAAAQADALIRTALDDRRSPLHGRLRSLTLSAPTTRGPALGRPPQLARVSR